MSRRRLYYLLQVGQFIRENEISKSEAENVGWTKLQMVAEHFARTSDSSNDALKRWLALAIDTNVPSLPKALQDEEQGEDPTEKRAVVFYLSLDEQIELNEALLAYGAEPANRGLKSREAALSQMIRAAMTAKE